jgi:hypothetical protein
MEQWIHIGIQDPLVVELRFNPIWAESSVRGESCPKIDQVPALRLGTHSTQVWVSVMVDLRRASMWRQCSGFLRI